MRRGVFIGEVDSSVLFGATPLTNKDTHLTQRVAEQTRVNTLLVMHAASRRYPLFYRWRDILTCHRRCSKSHPLPRLATLNAFTVGTRHMRLASVTEKGRFNSNTVTPSRFRHSYRLIYQPSVRFLILHSHLVYSRFHLPFAHLQLWRSSAIARE